jgi:hypothetical protein
MLLLAAWLSPPAHAFILSTGPLAPGVAQGAIEGSAGVGTVAAATIYGGAAVGSDLTIIGTSNVSPVNANIFLNPSLALTAGGVGIGLPSDQTPEGLLHIWGGSAGSTTASANGALLVLEANGTNGMSILVPDTSFSLIKFGSPSNVNGAQFGWRFSTLNFSMGTVQAGGSINLQVDSQVDALVLASDKSATFATLATTGAATGKTMVCADTNGKLYRSSSATNCLN